MRFMSRDGNFSCLLMVKNIFPTHWTLGIFDRGARRHTHDFNLWTTWQLWAHQFGIFSKWPSDILYLYIILGGGVAEARL